MNVRQKLSLAALCLTLPAMASAQAAAEPAAAPAAPKASVTVYGMLNVNFQDTMAKGATNPAQSVKSRNAVSTDSSNIGVKASADVAFGLTAIGQCEASANVDGVSVSGICNRNSRVGLMSPKFGTLFYGNWDTPFKAATYGTKADDPFGNTDVFGWQSLMGSPGVNTRSGGWVTSATSQVAGFDVRANNSVAYHSPKFAGMVAFKLQYSASEFANADGSRVPQLFSAAVNFDKGGLSLLAASEVHYNSYGLSVIAGNSNAHNTMDAAGRVGAGYQIDWAFGATTVGVVADVLSYAQDNAVVGELESYSRLAWQVSAKHRYADHEVRVRFNQALEGDCEIKGGGTCNADDSGASQITVGYAYHLSKAAQAYLSYTRIMNQDAAQYTLTIGGSPAVAGSTPAGADPTALGLGIRYAF